MQHDLFANPDPRSRRAYPQVVVLQADVSAGDSRLIAPLAPHTGPLASATSWALPVIVHEDAVTLPLISSLPRNQLRSAVGSLVHYRDDITWALDWLFFGI